MEMGAVQSGIHPKTEESKPDEQEEKEEESKDNEEPKDEQESDTPRIGPRTPPGRPDSPISPELMSQLLKIAHVTRYEAGLGPEEPRDDSGPSTSAQSAPKPSYVDRDYELALKLQEEEKRQADIERSYQSSSYNGPSTSGPSSSLSSEHLPLIELEEGEIAEGISAYPDEDQADEEYLLKEAWRMYRECKVTKPEAFLPKPMSVPEFHQLDFIKRYRDVLEGGTFSMELDEPGTSPESSNTTTTAYRLDLHKKLLIRIPKPPNPPKGKLPAGNPTAFQTLVKTVDKMRVPAKPLFSSKTFNDDDDDDDEGIFPRSSEYTYTTGQPPKKIEQTLMQKVQNSMSTPLSAVLSIEKGDEETLLVDEEYRGGSEGIFAVPAVPGQNNVGDIETSPAGRRIQNTSLNKMVFSNIRINGAHNQNNGFDGSGPSTSSRPPVNPYRSPLRIRTETLALNPDDDEEGLGADDPNITSTTTSTVAAASTWPSIAWRDPERMPLLDQIPDEELRKMPAEYIDQIIDYQIDGGSANVEQHIGKDTSHLERKYLELCRSYIQSPNRVPAEVMDSKFEIYIRFPFFERPLYVQNVLSALHIPDNYGNIMMNMPARFKCMSLAEFFKVGVNIWMGLKLLGTDVHKALSPHVHEDAVERFRQEVKRRLMKEVDRLVEEDKVYAENLIPSKLSDLYEQEITEQDITEMQVYRLKFLEEKQELAHRQRMKVVGNTLSRFLPSAAFGPSPKKVRTEESVDVGMRNSNDIPGPSRTFEQQDDEEASTSRQRPDDMPGTSASYYTNIVTEDPETESNHEKVDEQDE